MTNNNPYQYKLFDSPNAKRNSKKDNWEIIETDSTINYIDSGRRIGFDDFIDFKSRSKPRKLLEDLINSSGLYDEKKPSADLVDKFSKNYEGIANYKSTTKSMANPKKSYSPERKIRKFRNSLVSKLDKNLIAFKNKFNGEENYIVLYDGTTKDFSGEETFALFNAFESEKKGYMPIFIGYDPKDANVLRNHSRDIKDKYKQFLSYGEITPNSGLNEYMQDSKNKFLDIHKLKIQEKWAADFGSYLTKENYLNKSIYYFTPGVSSNSPRIMEYDVKPIHLKYSPESKRKNNHLVDTVSKSYFSLNLNGEFPLLGNYLIKQDDDYLYFADQLKKYMFVKSNVPGKSNLRIIPK